MRRTFSRPILPTLAVALMAFSPCAWAKATADCGTEITSLHVTRTTDGGATLFYQTNFSTFHQDSRIFDSHGKEVCSGFPPVATNKPSKAHTVSIPDVFNCALSPETQYSVQVTARHPDPSCSEKPSATRSFETTFDDNQCAGDTGIFHVNVSEKEIGCAAIHFETDQPTDTCIWYDSSWDGVEEFCLGDWGKDHQVVLGVSPSSQVDFYVYTETSPSTRSCSSLGGFQVSSQSIPAHTVSNIQIIQTQVGTATITFDTSNPAPGYVMLRDGDDRPYISHPPRFPPDPWDTSHQVVLSDLIPGHTYQFRINAGLCQGNGIDTPPTMTFTALSDPSCSNCT